MFCCSICNKAFDGVLNISTCTKKCGHVFHNKCLSTWLERSKTCPRCHSKLLKKNLIRLFVDVDPSSQETFVKNPDEEIKTLKEKIKYLKDRETFSSELIDRLETDLRKKKSTLDKSKTSAILFQKEAEHLKNIGHELTRKAHFLRRECAISHVNSRKIQDQCSSNESIIKSLQDQISGPLSIIHELKIEIADLKSEKAYFQSRCYDRENKNIEQPSTSKMNIENKYSISLQNQTKTQYYGHDPLLPSLSTKQFLLGCVFIFIEVEIKQVENNIIMSKVEILKYGGLVEHSYSSCITHVICVTQKHPIVEKAIKDGKRCLTDDWLRDIIIKKSMIPPWLAIHFPVPYRMDNLPCQNFQFSIFNFGIKESYIIKAMIELVGGDHAMNEVTTKTDIVISKKLKGKFVEKALATKKPVVNVQWLNDILFGAKHGIKGPGHLKYQEFDLYDPFKVNYNMVSHLMEAWKTPLIIGKKHRQISDLTLKEDGPTKNKRQETISENQNMTNLNNDGIDDNDVIITYIRTSPVKPCVMLVGFSTDNIKIYKRIIDLLGCTEPNEFRKATHLVMHKPTQSPELFFCLSTVNYILNEHWLKDSNSCSQLLDEKNYFIETIEDKVLGSCYLPAILENSNRRKLFSGLSFFVTPGIKYPSRIVLEKIILVAGGKIEKTRRSLESIQGLAPNSYFIISCIEQYGVHQDLFDLSNVIYTSEFITCSILAQKVQLQKFLIEVTAQN